MFWVLNQCEVEDFFLNLDFFVFGNFSAMSAIFVQGHFDILTFIFNGHIVRVFFGGVIL
jgi:hypothetical protein